MIYITVLSPALDVTYRIADLRSGRTYLDTESRVEPAGKGINVARVARLLGEQVTVVGLIPTYARQFVERFLQEHGIETLLLDRPGFVRVNATVLETQGNVTTHFSSTDAFENGTKAEEQLVGSVEKHARKGDFWILSGSLPGGMDPGLYRRIISLLHQRRARVFLDSRDEPLSLALRAAPDMTKPNLRELEGFFGEELRGIHHIALKGKRLLDMGIGHVFVSLGEDGAIALHEDDCLLCSPPRVQAHDSVGCGDAFVAGAVVGWNRRYSFPEMCRLAVACGASNTLHPGPGNVRREEAESIMEEVGIEAV